MRRKRKRLFLAIAGIFLMLAGLVCAVLFKEALFFFLMPIGLIIVVVNVPKIDVAQPISHE